MSAVGDVESRLSRRQELLDEVRMRANSLRLALLDYLGEGYPSQDARIEASSVLRQAGVTIVDREVLARFVASTIDYVKEKDLCTTATIATTFK